MKQLGIILILSSLWLNGCAYVSISADKVSAKQHENLNQAVTHFRQDERLRQYFDESVAYAVFPMSLRMGTGFGGGYGDGWLVENGELSGRCAMTQAFAGVNLGFTFFRQILFFQTQESLEAFKAGTFEFAGQGYLALGPWGKTLTPSYSAEVAIFSQNRFGLLFEGSVGAHRYDYRPFKLSP